MKVQFLSAKGYSDPSKNNGDCILVDNGSELVVYDCGCEEHARRVLNYMRQHGYRQAKVVLSHNDSDHFDGIPYLIERGAVSAVYTLLLLKYKDELEPYFIHVPNPDDNSFWDFTSRIMYDRVLFKKNDAEARFYNHIHCQYLFFDFFIMDNFPGGLRGKLQVFELKLLYVLATSKRYKLKYWPPKNPISRLAVFILCRLGMYIPLEWLFKRYDKVSRRYNKKKNCEDFILSNASASFLADCIYKKKWYKTRTELPVRGRNFFVPGEYDESLRNYYGDYMQLPPEESRYPEHIENFEDVAFLNEK